MSDYIKCECGMIVKGTSQKQAEAMLQYHTSSKIHKKQLQYRKEMKGGK